MKPTLLLMMAVVYLLSCQKDTDQGCPLVNKAAKEVNDLGIPIQTCGKAVKDSVLFKYAFSIRYPDPSYAQTPTPGFTVEPQAGSVTVYNDYQYLYIKTFNIDSAFFSVTSSDGQVTYTGEFNYLPNDIQLLKIPVSQFPENQIILVRYNTLYGQLASFTDLTTEIPTEIYFQNIKQGLSVITQKSEFKYQISPCCNPNE